MSTQAIPQPEIEQVQHPTLGALKFPKDMPYDQRNQIIAEMESQQKPSQGVLGKVGSALWGAAKQAGGAIFDPNGISQAALPPASDADINKGPLQGLKDAVGASRLSNIPRSLWEGLKEINPVAPTFNNPNTAEGVGQSAVNLLMLRNQLTGRVPVADEGALAGGAGAAARGSEVAQPLNPRPLPPKPAQTPAAPRSVDQLLQDAMSALDKKYPGTRAAWEASKVEAPKPQQDIPALLQQSIKQAQAGKGIGPGTAHVTDPGFATGKMMGAHADLLNNLPDISSNRAMNFSHVTDYNNAINDPSYAAPNAKHMSAVGKLMDKYRTDPDFKNLADAARMYVHNYRVIGDIDKMSLGLPSAHYSVNSLDPMHEIPWDVDPDTRMFDGKPFGRGTISYDEGRQMAETLTGAVRNATERDVPLYRGITPYRGVDQLAAGDTIQLPLSSFSDRLTTATSFGNNFMFELTGPSKHLNIKPFNSMMEGEHLTQGRFEVVGTGTKTITHPPFHSGGKAVTETVRYVKIRQLGTF